MLPISVIVSNSHIVLAEENHQWPLPRFHEPPESLSGPQFALLYKQKIINITDVVWFFFVCFFVMVLVCNTINL